MSELSELSEWVWLIVAVIWVAARALPRLFRKQSRSPSPKRSARPAVTEPPPGRPFIDSPAAPPAPGGGRIDAQTLRRIQSAEPIEPR